jgi:hypothetical protein
MMAARGLCLRFSFLLRSEVHIQPPRYKSSIGKKKKERLRTKSSRNPQTTEEETA